MAAVTLTKTVSGVMGDLRYYFGTLALSSSYATGGDTLGVAQVNEGWTEIKHVQLGTGEDATYRASYDPSAGTVLLFLEASAGDGTEDEVSNGTDVSTIGDIPVMIFGY